MQFEPPASPYPPYSPYAYAYPTPPPNMAPRGHAFYDFSGVGSIPTPAPSPRTSQHSRRRSHDYNAEYGAGIRRPTTGVPDYGHYPHGFATPPRPHTRAGAVHNQYTPLHTPPPTSHAQHGPVPDFYSHMPAFSPPAEYFTAFPGGPTSPPPHPPPQRDRTRSSRSHRRESTWAGGEPGPRSPPRPPPRRAKTTGLSEEVPLHDPELVKRKAAEHGIPADYSLKNWDPNERPIILLGSVFDANSLGEWIFNWTKFHHGRYSDATKVAGQLWELLIALGGKLKRAREFFGLIAKQENREIVEDFMENGERLWQKLKTVLKACEEYMWNGAKNVEKNGTQTVQMGRKSGAEFVEAMFSADKEWERTEKLMRGVATWCQRFEVNCEEILKRPDA